MTNQESSQSEQKLTAQEQLEARLHVRPGQKPCPPPELKPDNNPLYPKRVTQLRSLKNTGQVNHFSQIQAPPKVLQKSQKQEEQKPARVVINHLIEPLEAVKTLQGAPENEFFYMQRVDKLRLVDQSKFKPGCLELLKQKEEFEILVCPHTVVDLKNYMTLSMKGVAQINEDQHSMTDLAEWVDELQKLQKLRQISIFKNFRLWKPLKLLKKAVLKNRFFRSSMTLQKNLFPINLFLRHSLSLTLECTQQIRQMLIVVTQHEIDQFNQQKSKKQKEKRIMAQESGDMKRIKDGLQQRQKAVLKMFENFLFCRQLQEEKVVDENQTEAQPETYMPPQDKLYKYPFQVKEFDELTLVRCKDMSLLFDKMMQELLVQIRQMINEEIIAKFCANQTEKTIKIASSYTEKAARINLCKRLVNYLKQTDFMIMDALYDFQYNAMSLLHARIEEAGAIPLPPTNKVIFSKEELLERERSGMYCFDGKQAEEKQDEEAIIEEGNAVVKVGDGSKQIFLGFVQCQLVEQKSNGCRELRQNVADLDTPGDVIKAGQQAAICLSPSADDFYHAIDNYNESLLSVLDCIKRFTNHEDFADISLPVYSNTEATFEHVEDVSKIQILQEVSTPTLQVLFASNPEFRTLVNAIKSDLYQQYENAVKWSTILQPFFDAFNQCLNINVDQLERKLFQVPTGMFDGGDLSNVDKKWADPFSKIVTLSIHTPQNNYDVLLQELLLVDIKDLCSLSENVLTYEIKSKADVPLCSKSGLTQFTMQEFLISDQEFDDLLLQMEHNRRLHTSMPEMINLGMFSFDSAALKEAFLPVSQRVLNFLRTAIPHSIIKRILLLIINMNMMKKYLTAQYYDIESFILYREVVTLISDEVVDVIKALYINITQLAHKFATHGTDLPPQITNLFTFFNQQFEQFKQLVISSEAGLDALTNQWLDKQTQECYKCQESLQFLKSQLRLKSINKQVPLFTMAQMANFITEYGEDVVEFQKVQEEYLMQKDQYQQELEKLEQNNVDEQTISQQLQKIEEIDSILFPECMLVSVDKLTFDTIIKQHQFYISKDDQVEEEQEPDELEEERAITTEEDNVTEMTTTTHQEVKLDGLDIPQQEVNLHQNISSILIQLQHRSDKTGKLKDELDKVESKIKQVRSYQQQLQADLFDFPLLDEVSSTIRQFNQLWSQSLLWMRQMLVFNRQKFMGDLNQESLSQLVSQVGKTAFMCERTLQNNEMPGILKKRVQEMRQMLPIITSLDNQALRQSHWTNVSNILGKPVPTIEKKEDGTDKIVNIPQVTISWLVNSNALLYKDQLSQVSNNAANEQSLEKQFRKIELEWQKININSAPYKDQHDLFVLRDTAELITKLEDSILVVSGLVCSRYVANLKESVEGLFERLKQLNYAIEVFLKVQKGYLYLSNIFNSGDIQKQLPNETKMFQDLDNFWRKLMSKIQDYPTAINITQFSIIPVKDEANISGLSLKPSILEIQLKKQEMVLELIQKSLDDYLQTKRMLFPRLFFISDDELLDLLAQAKNPHMLQGHMRKLFENVVQMELVNNAQAGGLEIVALISEEGERLPLVQSVKPRGSVVAWLSTLEQKMKQSVAKSVKQAIDGYGSFATKNQWILQNFGQAIIAAGQVFWCAYLTEAIDGPESSDLLKLGYGKLKGEANIFQTLKNVEQKDKKQSQQSPLNLYYSKFEADLQNLITLIKSNITKLQRGSITALATIETHSRDSIQQLIHAKPAILSTQEFEFQKLQRYYYNPQDIETPIYIKQNTTTCPYQNEYLGASGRLVITPLTDLVFLHIAVSVQNNKAINLAGPAGTGKSETTKDQNKSRANSCVVFNCSENVEISVMNRFFTGFCMSGAGSCLDEFNRLELSLLSVIAGSIKQILDGLKIVRNSDKKNFVFNGKELPLDPETMIAISLNPGYAGRAELPQNLKNLFRSFSMVVPDYALISEIILFSQGFSTAKSLSRKVVQLYKLSSEQLSQQNSYDFGMRGVKSVLSMAGNLRRKFPDQSEEMVLISAMSDSNLPRMIADDRLLFQSIISDLFPSIIYEKSNNIDFNICIDQSISEKQLQKNPVFVEKINQVFETCQIRHGVLLMGTAKSGKSVCLNVMTDALGKLRHKVEKEYSADKKKIFDSNFPWTIVNETDVHLINSKAFALNELYGSYDDVSGEWKDGLIGNVMRMALENSKVAELKTRKQFILFDSHVSTEWIESMNSLLDDSKLLCLANSERLKINDYINIMFECETLRHASPATVSRLGIINFPECTLQETLKIQTILMRPPNGFKNMTDDEVQAHEANVLRTSISSSLHQSIVRWDHLIDTWFQRDLVKIQTFALINDTAQSLPPSSIEQKAFKKIKLLIYKMFESFLPQGLKFMVTNNASILPTNEIQLVKQTIDIFSALLSYNRSMSVVMKNDKQKELNKFAQENGLSEPQQAQEVNEMQPVDLTLLCKFLCFQFCARNVQLLQNPLPGNKMAELVEEHVFDSREYQAYESMIKQCFVFAFIWAFGGVLAAGQKQAREEFDALVRQIIEDINEENVLIKTSGKDFSNNKSVLFENIKEQLQFGIQFPLMPNQGSVFDYYVDWRALIQFQEKIAELFPCLTVNPKLKQQFTQLDVKNDQLFSVGTCAQLLQHLQHVSNLLPQLNDEQQTFSTGEMLKDADIRFETFQELLTPYVYKPKVPFFNIFIETVDTLRYQHLMETILKHGLPLLLTGQAGSGKTSVVSSMLNSLDKRGLTQNIQVNFSARTSSIRIQQIIEDSLFQKGKTYLPQIGKSGIVYIDDLNLPAKDQYDCSQPIEFLRFFMDTKGFYDRKEWFWKTVEKTTLLSSCAPPGGGRETLTARITSSFTMITQPESEDESLVKIYNTILESYFAYGDYKYPQDIVQSCQGLVKALIQIYHNLSNILKPTPSKLHYSFNLRDVSKVIQGMMRSSSKVLKSNDELVSLFIHENMRVFADRTINAFDNEQVARVLTEALNTAPGTGLKKALVFECLFEDDGSIKQYDEIPKNEEFVGMWGSYMKFGAPQEERIFETKDAKFTQNIMYQYLEQYNTESGKQKMNLVLFEDAVQYINKIARILSSERGNLLNVGVGGSGRKSLTKLAASMCEYQVESIQLKKGYGQADFHADVKELYMKCGLKGENIVFLLDESQLVSDAILEDINNILNSGVISNLFDQKDMEKIINDTRSYINEQGYADVVDVNNKASVFNFFTSRVRDKLHIVLCMSPSGDEFRARLRTYPSLLTCMSIVWFHQWPRSALLDVSKRILTDDLQKVDFEAIVLSKDADVQLRYAKQLALKLAPVATEIHSNTEKLLQNYAKETNRKHYLPPATFLDLLSIYSTLLNSRIKEIATRLQQFETGVQRLIDAKNQVETLQKQQEELKPVLEQKTIATNELIEQINIETIQVNELRKKAMDDAQIVAVQTKDCQMIAADADRDLKACEPIIQEATRAVDNIDSGMIAEMKQVKNPAPLVFLTMQSVAVLLGYKPDWAGCVQMFSNAQFLNTLKEYDKNNIADTMLKALKKYTETKQYDLTAIERVSVACKSLAVWVLAIEKYAQVYREVEPKRKRLQQANDDLQIKQEALKIKQAQLKKVEDAFQELQNKFNQSNNEKISLEKAMALTKARLDRAEKLTDALGDERVRWVKQSEQLKELITMVVGDVFLASCGIGYFGVFTRDYRTKLITYWHGLLEIYGVKTQPIEQILQKGLFGLISSDEIVIEKWKDCGLPNDMQSIDNAVIMDQVMKQKWPLLIDPQNQAANFIKKLEKKITIIRPSQGDIIHKFESALREGYTVILEGVGEKLDPTLQPIIEKQFVSTAGGQQSVNLGGDQSIEINKDFKLYITTKLQNPRYTPEIHAKLQIINFSISVDALESQILNEVIQLEYPKLEETRVELAKDASDNRKMLLELADKILFNLSSFKGSVLDNEPLINVLNDSKKLSQVIKEKEIASASTKIEIAKYYELYKPIGTRAALIYFLISDMSMVEQMYLFALGYYKSLVQQEIKKISDHKGDQNMISQRVEIIIEKLSFSLFNSITRGLFEKDKNIFAFLLGCRICQRGGIVQKEEWNLFVKGKVYADIFLQDPVNTSTNSSEKLQLLEEFKKSTLNDKIKTQVEAMIHIAYLQPLAKTIMKNYDNFFQLLKQSKQPQDIINFIITLGNDDQFHKVKAMMEPQTTSFQRMILLKLIAEEYFYLSIPQLVEQMLDKRYSSIQPQSIKQLYLDSNQYSPMLFIISEGVDPVAQTCQLAEEMKQQISIISLGKGQTPLVKSEIKKATAEGRWVFLQNVHLAAADFLPELELMVETINLSQGQTTSQLDYLNLPVHPSFRLLLSSTPTDTFPQSVLQASLKCTTEPPLGMKKNILRQTQMMDPARFEFESQKAKIPSHLNSDGVILTWKRVVYALMYFHSQILERKKFGPQGYNLNYDFNDTDLEICILTLEDFFIKSFKSPQSNTDVFIQLDWKALEFIFSAVHYCGKVNDSWDKRCVDTMLKNVVGQKLVRCSNSSVVESAQKFHWVESDHRYSMNYISNQTTLDEIVTKVNLLPSLDSTKVFGMSENSDIVNQQSEAFRIVQRVLGVSADCLQKISHEQTLQKTEQTASVAKVEKELTKEEQLALTKQKIQELNLKVFGEEVKTKTVDEIVRSITETLLKKLPKLLNINDATPASMGYDEHGTPLCMTTILKQEMERFNTLLQFIKKSLINVGLAIKGDVILSQDLEDQYKSLYVGKVPAAWSKIAYPSLKPLASWFDDLILRVDFMKKWLVEKIPASFWISGLYFPQGFVTALLQTHARKYKISIDSLKFDFQFSNLLWDDHNGFNLEKPDEKEPTAVWIHGLYVDCGFFSCDDLKLKASKEGMLYPKMPFIKLVPTNSTAEQLGYKSPVYKTSQRAGVLSSTGHSTNFILPIILPSDEPEDFFVRLGTALLCQLDE